MPLLDLPVRPGVTLRPDTPEDRPFLRRLFAAARQDAQLLALWPASQREPFLDQQFSFQDLHYRRYYAEADFLVVEQDGAPVGRVVLDRSTPSWCLVDIAILPENRGQGLGHALLAAMLNTAKAEGADAITLNVESGNWPAHRLYLRLGFVETESESDAHIAMIARLS